MGNEPQPGGQKPQGEPQVTPGNLPTTKADVPDNSEEPKLYTETELKAKLSEQQSKIRKELQPLRDKITVLEADKSSLEAQVEDVEVLNETIKKLHTEIEEGLPAEGKDAYDKYIKKLANLTEAEIRTRKDTKVKDDELSKYRKTDLERTAESLAAKFGVEKESLMDCKNETEMKAKAAELYDPAKVTKAAETKQETTQETTQSPAEQPPVTKMPSLETSGATTGGLSDAEFWKGYGKMPNPTPADHKRAEQIRTNALKG